jgi:hypothetical protein
MSKESYLFKAVTGIALAATMNSCSTKEIQNVRGNVPTVAKTEQTTPSTNQEATSEFERNESNVTLEMSKKPAIDTANGFLNACEKLSENLSDSNPHCYVVLEKGKIFAVVLPFMIGENQSNTTLQSCLALSQFDNKTYKGLNNVLDSVPSDKTLVISRESGNLESNLIVTNLISQIQKLSIK